MKKLISFLFIMSFIFPAVVSAKKTTYIYTNYKFNFVKIEGMSRKESKETKTTHPFEFTDDQMNAILQSVRLNEKLLFKKEAKNQNVFSDRAINILAPKLVDAFRRATSKDKIVFSFLEKDSKFIFRNDKITIGEAWISGKELHIKFNKLLAKMTGDYNKRGYSTKSVAKSRGLRVSLEAGEGQMLGATSGDELIINTAYDFATAVKEKSEKLANIRSEKNTEKNESVVDRLRTLDRLKDEGLVTDKEYKKKKKAILKEL